MLSLLSVITVLPLNLNKYDKSVRPEGGDKVRVSSKRLFRLGTLFLQILSSVCLAITFPLSNFR